MSAYIEHVARDGDRWDLLAWHYYGDATRMSPIIEANPQLRILPVFAAGTVVYIPIMEAAQAAEYLSAEDLPPWKR